MLPRIIFLAAHHCSLLSGEWSGKSVRSLVGGGVVETVWLRTQLQFDPASGTIKGEGVSLWQEQQFPFQLLGAVNPQLNQVEMLKSHRSGPQQSQQSGSGGNGTVTHFTCMLDISNQIINGQFGDAHGGGTLMLQRVQQGPPGVPPPGAGGVVGSFGNLVARSASGSSASSVPSQQLPLPLEPPPADLAAFLLIAFPDQPGVAGKILQTLRSNEIHEAESLSTLGPEDWKELGVVLGHRSKIKLALQRCYPHLMMKHEHGMMDDGMPGAGGASQPSSAGGAPGSQQGGSSQQSQQNSAEPVNVGYLSQGGPSQGGAPGFGAGPPPGSHYAPLPPPGSGYPSHQGLLSGPPGVNVGVGVGVGGVNVNVPAPPLEFLCPITHELMEDPVLLVADGHSYERLSIEQWLLGHKTSPITNKIVPSKQLQPNFQLRNAINMWKQQFGVK